MRRCSAEQVVEHVLGVLRTGAGFGCYPTEIFFCRKCVFFFLSIMVVVVVVVVTPQKSNIHTKKWSYFKPESTFSKAHLFGALQLLVFVSRMMLFW